MDALMIALWFTGVAVGLYIGWWLWKYPTLSSARRSYQNSVQRSESIHRAGRKAMQLMQRNRND